ncbi:unnamed protein product [Protopolystoma xenopodis]|uniref:Uncharacterized protein n=1 Tax=Protopolystoma xenopodis TaxID=117903 RepID=A0A3S5CVC9_9PLAT|nr:unnamed protein product [Protopolystoma xenopodis]
MSFTAVARGCRTVGRPLVLWFPSFFSSFSARLPSSDCPQQCLRVCVYMCVCVRVCVNLPLACRYGSLADRAAHREVALRDRADRDRAQLLLDSVHVNLAGRDYAELGVDYELGLSKVFLRAELAGQLARIHRRRRLQAARRCHSLRLFCLTAVEAGLLQRHFFLFPLSAFRLTDSVCFSAARRSVDSAASATGSRQLDSDLLADAGRSRRASPK